MVRDTAGKFAVTAANRGTLRFCSRCQEYLPRTDFYKDARGEGGLARKCKLCHSQQSYESRLKRMTPSARYDYERARTLRKYGMTVADYEEMVLSQNGQCAICGNSGGFNSRYVPLVVDHCHTTGAVRGLLCGTCNSAIGKMRDSPELLIAAADYLRKHAQPDCD